MNSFAEKPPEILKSILERNSVDSILNSNKNILPGQARIRMGFRFQTCVVL